MTEPMRLRAASLESEVGTLSGGNQQKVALAKWLQTRPRLLLLDEPTRGIDVAAKREIYQLVEQWTAEGIAILLITSEMPELLTLSDRIAVLHRGRVTAEFSREPGEAILPRKIDLSARCADRGQRRNNRWAARFAGCGARN
jgi:ribose transport system ATP-binding protein